MCSGNYSVWSRDSERRQYGEHEPRQNLNDIASMLEFSLPAVQLDVCRWAEHARHLSENVTANIGPRVETDPTQSGGPPTGLDRQLPEDPRSDRPVDRPAVNGPPLARRHPICRRCANNPILELHIRTPGLASPMNTVVAVVR